MNRESFRIVAIAAVAAFALLAAIPALSMAALPEIHNRTETTETFTGHSEGQISFELASRNFFVYRSATISGEIPVTPAVVNGEEALEPIPKWKTLNNVTLQFKDGTTGACYNEWQGGEPVLTLSGLKGYFEYVSNTNHAVVLSIYKKYIGDAIRTWTPCFNTLVGKPTLRGGALNMLISPLNSYTRTHALELTGAKTLQGFKEYAVAPLSWEYEGSARENIGISGRFTFETPNEVIVAG